MPQFRHIAALIFLAVSYAGTALAGGTPVVATELHAAYARLKPQLANNAFGRPLVLESREGERQVGGEVYAVVDYPFATVRRVFASPGNWCDVLILHLNTKYCGAAGNSLAVRVGRKHAQELDEGFGLQFNYALRSATPKLLVAEVTAPSGPLGSRDYRIELQAIPLDSKRSFLRLHYSYGYGAAAKVATQGYLATGGSGKIGFTRVGKGYVRGMRGAIERNTMRYFLAIDAYLASLKQPPGRQFASRIERWFDATEKYRAQLHEMERAEYLQMKHGEYARQKAVAAR